MPEGDSLLQYPKHHDSNGGEGPSTTESSKHVQNSQTVSASKKTDSLQVKTPPALEHSMEDKQSVRMEGAMGPDNAKGLETETPKPRERKVELITYKSVQVECGLKVTDTDLVAESSVNMISTNRDRKRKEIIFEMAGDGANGDRESMRLLSFCRSVFTIASSGGLVQSAETEILNTKPELSNGEIPMILDEWDVLINCVGERIASCGSKILSGSNKGPLSLDLLRILANITDVADQLERDAIMLEQGLKHIAKEEWRRKATELKESIKSDLVTKVNSLFGRASNIMSIDEAYRAREQNASLKRLSWITFIFLPLLFVSSLYGMNVDILKDNPRWTTYFYIAVPTFVLVILTVVLLKYLPLESMKPACQPFLDSIRTRTRVWDEEGLPNAMYNDVHQGLLNASTVGSTEIINRVLCKNSRKLRKIFGNNGGNYLCAAVENGHEAVVQLLLEKGADKDEALNLAARSGQEAVVRLLLEMGADKDKAGYGGKTPLSLAAWEGHGRKTPLSLAAWDGHEAVVRFLLEEGVDKDKVHSFGDTPLSLAAENGHEAVVRLLLEKGADKDKANIFGNTALNLAACGGHDTIVRLLLEKGADKDKANSSGNTALSLAALGGHDAIIVLLETYDKRE